MNDALRDLQADGVDQRVVHQRDLVCGSLLDQVAEPRDPQPRDWVAAGSTPPAIPVFSNSSSWSVKLLAAEVGRIDRMRVDQERVDAGTAQHGCGSRSGEAAADDGDIRMPHGPSLTSAGHHCDQMA